jgi:hypothetical protein|tara:strand:- start:225 stop:590 length:366 start_codon:yes stop_codon:yes gene_type:complete
MAHFAELDENNIVLRVVVVGDPHEADGENWCKNFFGTNNWKQTSYNTYMGVHLYDGFARRKNYAGVGYSYDQALDAFIPPKIHGSWILNTDTCHYEAPIPHPDDGIAYDWNESTGAWDVRE